jgi:hypothetical protein
MPKKRLKKCCLCGVKPVFSIKTIYCRECSHFCARLSNERFPPEVCQALKNDVRKRGGFFCHYTEMELNVFDYEDPYFLEFDHVVPNDPSEVVMTSAWFNEIKGDLILKELKSSVAQLFNYWFKGIKIKKKKFRYWYRLKRG